MASKELDHMSEIRSVYDRMDELKKAHGTSVSALTKAEKAFEKARLKVDEARSAVKTAESDLNAFAVEQKRAMQKIMTMISKDPNLAHDLLGKALNLTLENPSSDGDAE